MLIGSIYLQESLFTLYFLTICLPKILTKGFQTRNKRVELQWEDTHLKTITNVISSLLHTLENTNSGILYACGARLCERGAKVADGTETVPYLPNRHNRKTFVSCAWLNMAVCVSKALIGFLFMCVAALGRLAIQEYLTALGAARDHQVCVLMLHCARVLTWWQCLI